MIVLPESSIPMAKAGLLNNLLTVTSSDCPVMRLAVEFNELVREYNGEAKRKRARKSVLERVSNRLDHIEDEASLAPPQSAQGAAFQIMLASYLNDPARHGDYAINEDYAANMSRRLLTQALKFFGSAAHDFPHALDYLVGIKALEKN